jgi:hypothetical protein
MKRTLLVIIALFLILDLRLFAFGGGALTKTASFPAPNADPTFGKRISEEVTSPSTPADDSVAREKTSEEVAVSPIPDEDKTLWEVTPPPMPVGDPIAGEKIFASACKVCHGKDKAQSEFIASKSDQELVEFIRIGGVPEEPRVMLPKGGNPTLTDKNLYDIVAYLRTP